MTKTDKARALGVAYKTFWQWSKDPTFPANGSVSEIRHWREARRGSVPPRSRETEPSAEPSELDAELSDELPGSWYERYKRAAALEKEEKLEKVRREAEATALARAFDEVAAFLAEFRAELRSLNLPAKTARRVNEAITTCFDRLESNSTS